MAARVIVTRLPRIFGAEAMAITPSLILIVADREHDEALLAHERKHQEQQRTFGWGWWVLRYFNPFSGEFRLEMEVEAYRVQLALQPGSIERFAAGLASRYFLGIDTDTARALLLAPPTDAKKDHAP